MLNRGDHTKMNMVALSNTRPTVHDTLGTPDGARGETHTHTAPVYRVRTGSQQNVESPFSQRPLTLSGFSPHSVDPNENWNNVESTFMGTGNRNSSINRTQRSVRPAGRGNGISSFSPGLSPVKDFENILNSPFTARTISPQRNSVPGMVQKAPLEKKNHLISKIKVLIRVGFLKSSN